VQWFGSGASRSIWSSLQGGCGSKTFASVLLLVALRYLAAVISMVSLTNCLCHVLHGWSMSTPTTICALLLTAFILALSWALHSLASTRSASSFVVLCVVTFAAMVVANYVVVRWLHSSEL
jgi:hypothetical protein